MANYMIVYRIVNATKLEDDIENLPESMPTLPVILPMCMMAVLNSSAARSSTLSASSGFDVKSSEIMLIVFCYKK